MSRILVIDDDPNILSAFRDLLGGQGHRVFTAAGAEPGIELVEVERPDLILMDVRMPGIDGLEAFRRIRRIDSRLPVIVVTGYATAEVAIEATKLGAFDYHLKPLDPEELMRSIRSALESVRLMRRQVEMDNQAPAPSDAELIIGQSSAMQEVYKRIGRVSPTDATVLILGETGTGKELVARAIYHHSLRAAQPLTIVNCVAIPEALLESELFGHERGAFTGAEYRRVGKFEQAAGGTLFLDEIGDMPLSTQAKLLRVLQEKKITRVGGNEVIPIDVRILAATNRNLDSAIANGHFREDLFYRLKGFTIHLPPLRDRREDIERLANYFLKSYASELELPTPYLNPETIEALAAHNWPGNVRELQHCMRRAAVFSRGYPIRADSVAELIAEAQQPATVASSTRSDRDSLDEAIENYFATAPGDSSYSGFMALAEKRLVLHALKLHRGNQTHTARMLGITRPTLKAKMDRHGIKRPTDYLEN
jgi:two-component system NtrC family response regulator/two-component system nitrogen regulation response regulator GlnG